MEMRLASEHLTLPRKLSLHQMVKHSIAQKFWGEFVLKEVLNDDKDPDSFCRRVAPHRNAVLNNVLKAFSTYLPEKLMNEVLHAVIDLQEGYRKAHYWERKHELALPFTILNPLTSDSYAAGYFITPGGHFDDLSWAKKFVSDENQCVQKRFQLACFYCFEDQILHLWNTMKTNVLLSCNSNLDQIKKFGDLVFLWACHIENKMHEFAPEYEYPNTNYDNTNFMTSGFNAAAWSFHKDATHFFWTRCSDNEKRYILQNIGTYFLSLAADGDTNDAEFIYFIYSSIFPVEKRNSLIASSMQLCVQSPLIVEAARMWCCLLRSQFWEPILKDILTFPHYIPSTIYYEIVYCLFYDLTAYEIPFHKEIVKIVWSKFCQLKEKVVCRSLFLIEDLEGMNAIDLLETVIEPLCDYEKEKLLNEYPDEIIARIVEFSKADNYDAVLRYLFAFLIDRSQVNQKLRVDASKFLNYIDKKFLKNRIDELSYREKNELNKVIVCVQGSLQVLDHLLEKVENVSGRKTTSYLSV